MSKEWYVMRGSDEKRYGPFDDGKLEALAADGRLEADDLVWRNGMIDWVEAISLENLSFELPPPSLPPRARSEASVPVEGASHPASGTKIAAGICGILLGCLGVHKFVIGATTPGVVMLLVSILTCGWGAIPMSVIGIIEGVIYLTKSDQEFEKEYVIGKKGWF